MPMPGMPGEDPAQNPGSQPITPEEKAIIVKLLQDVQSKLSNFHATNFAATNKVELVRRQLLTQVFEKLQMAGVDLSDQASVKEFMTNLQQSNPTLAAGFERAMNVLLGNGDTGFATPTAQPPMDDAATAGAPAGMPQTNETSDQAVPPTV